MNEHEPARPIKRRKVNEPSKGRGEQLARKIENTPFVKGAKFGAHLPEKLAEAAERVGKSIQKGEKSLNKKLRALKRKVT